MTLKVSELLEKAQKKGLKPEPLTKSNLLKTWQQESVLFENSQKEERNVSNINQTQTQHKQHTNPAQTTHKLNTNNTQTRHNKKHKPNTNNTQTQHKPNTKLNTNRTQKQVIFLTGNEKKIMLCLCENCKENRAEITQPLSAKYISENSFVKLGSVKNTLSRLISKKFLLKINVKNGGPGALTQYKIPNEIYKEVLNLIDSETLHKLHTKLDTNASSSSSNVLNTTTTKDEQFLNDVDISPLEEIGFTKNHLKQFCAIENVTPKIIQDSINHFAHDLKKNEKEKEIKKTPLEYFMGIMKRGGYYNAPDNYESPQDKATREWIEKEEKQKKLREEQRMKVFNLAFDKWLDSLTEEEAREIFHNENPHSRIPFKGKGDSGFSQAMLRNYYRKKIWINERKELGLDGFWDHFNDDETT